MAVATTMISYGGFLGACGWYGAHTSGAMHSLYAGVGSGAVMVLCGANSFGEPKKGDKVRASALIKFSTPSCKPSTRLTSRPECWGSRRAGERPY